MQGPRARQFALAAALAAVIGGTTVAGWFLLRPSYQVLFSDLKRQDASSIAAELDKQKIPFRFDEKTSSILVPEGDTRATRLKLMSGDLRLQGVVGLELFNNSDLGLTDFAQKVNYQRALQGELARTIMTLDEIELARVHLTLPESSLFRRDNARPKASVALFVRDGQRLGVDTISGIRRLVAAAVPELAAADVSVLDQRGAPAGAIGNEIDEPGLRLKQAIEQGYAARIAAQIERVIGAGHATVSVDASVNLDQVRTTRELDITRPVADESTAAPTARDSSPPVPKQALPAAGLPPLPQASASRPPDGTRSEHNIEQIIRSPGTLRRLSIGIVFDKPLPPGELANLSTVISASVGLDPSRGDVLSTFVHEAPPAGIAAAEPDGAAPTAAALPASGGDTTGPGPASHRNGPGPVDSGNPFGKAWIGVFALAVLTLVVLGGFIVRRLRASSRGSEAQHLPTGQRDLHVMRLRALLAQQEGVRGPL
jgi:flagellar M-ring protein FliF